MAPAAIRQMNVNGIVNDLLDNTDDMNNTGKNQYCKNCSVLNFLHDAIINTEKYTAEEWVDLYLGMKKLFALRPHIDLIVNLRKVEAEATGSEETSTAH